MVLKSMAKLTVSVKKGCKKFTGYNFNRVQRNACMIFRIARSPSEVEALSDDYPDSRFVLQEVTTNMVL